MGIIFIMMPWYKGYTQYTIDTLAIDTMTQIKEVDPIEASFLFSYYEQDGTKSPVTGGIGDESLIDRVETISLTIPINRKFTITFLEGIDVYSSASTDNINNEYGLYEETSASRHDLRAYGNLGVQINNEKKRRTYGFNVGGSSEWDVKSFNYSASISQLSKNRNTLFYAKASGYNDYWKLIYPSELRWKTLLGNELLANNKRQTYDGLITISQDLTPKMKGSLTFGTIYQNGLLSTPFHRVYFSDSDEHSIERLPSHRLKFPMGLRFNYYINQHMIVRLFYRYYFDDFGIQAHTASIELPIKPIQSIAIAPFYRFHTQTASKYFKKFGFHSVDEEYYTSDFDLANIQGNRVGLEFRYSPLIYRKRKKESDKKRVVFKKITLRSSKYFRSGQKELLLKSFLVTMELKFRIE